MVTYVFFSQPFTLVYEEMYGVVNQTNSSASQSALQTFDILNIVWKYWPILFLFLLIIWAIVAAQKKEPYEYVEGI
jgi:hypothetical protein